MKIIFYFCITIKKLKTMFETYFKTEMKRLRLKRYDVCGLIKCTMPTLKNRIENPKTFTIEEIMILQTNGFNLDIFKILEVIN